MAAEHTDLDVIASELYGLPLEQFTTARNERAQHARLAGDRALAERVRNLRKPTTSAWVANQLVRERPEDVRAFLELGQALRDAQASLSGEAMRSLSRQRRQVIGGLVQQARRISAQRGQPIGDAVSRELQGTMEAALADPQAAETFAAGTLTGALTHSGMGPSAGSVLWPVPDVPTGAAAEAESQQQERAPRRSAEERERAEQEAARASEQARRDADDSERSVFEHREELNSARARHKEAERRVQELESDLAEAREEEARAGRASQEAKQAMETADKHARQARRRARDAEAQATQAARAASRSRQGKGG